MTAERMRQPLSAIVMKISACWKGVDWVPKARLPTTPLIANGSARYSRPVTRLKMKMVAMSAASGRMSPSSRLTGVGW